MSFAPSASSAPLVPQPRSLPRAAPWAPLLAALALAGCATWTPPASLTAPENAVPVPQTWAGQEAVQGAVQTAGQAAAQGEDQAADAPAQPPEPLHQWWQRLGDEQLTGLIAQALQAHTSMRSARAAVEQARAQRDVQAAGLLPSLDASGSAQRSRSSGNTRNNFQLGLDASWEPDLFGRLFSGVQASEADLLAAEAGLAAAQVALAAEVAVNYIDLRSQQQRLQIARQNLATQRETAQITLWRVQAGLASSVAAEQARTIVEQTAAQLPSLQAGMAQSRHALAVLTGQPPAALDEALAASAPVPQPPDTLALAFPADTLRQRPDVLQAGQRVRAAWARVAQAEANRMPSLRIGGTLGLQALTLGGLTGGGATVASLLGSVSLPVFDGGALRAQVRVQQAALDQARVGYEEAVLVALQDVEDALVALQGERQRLDRLGAAAEAAGNAALLAQHQYASGLVDFQTVLDTQRTLLSAQDNVASSTANVATGHVRLYKALGGGWQAP